LLHMTARPCTTRLWPRHSLHLTSMSSDSPLEITQIARFETCEVHIEPKKTLVNECSSLFMHPKYLQIWHHRFNTQIWKSNNWPEELQTTESPLSSTQEDCTLLRCRRCLFHTTRLEPGDAAKLWQKAMESPPVLKHGNGKSHSTGNHP
jgi:hypothetical protein